MLKRERRGVAYGFTLIELLVVVAIIVVLIAILMPSLANARTQAKAMQCGANLRTTGQAIIGFASENDGRMPGGAYTTFSVAWYTILNDEYFGKTVGSKDYQNIMLQPMYGSMGSGYSKSLGTYAKAIFCPLFTPGSNTDTRRCYMYNWDASGGQGGTGTTPGPYGLLLADPKTRSSTYTAYWLGAKYSGFNGSQILVTESNRASDLAKPITPAGTNGYLIPDPSPFPVGSYGSNGLGNTGSGFFMFRHNNTGTLASFLFFDGHVESISPTDEYNTNRRLRLGY